MANVCKINLINNTAAKKNPTRTGWFLSDVNLIRPLEKIKLSLDNVSHGIIFLNAHSSNKGPVIIKKS